MPGGMAARRVHARIELGERKGYHVAKQATDAADGADEHVYTLIEAARLKGVSYHTASRAVRSGKLPARRLGRMALVSASDVAAWRPMVERAPKKYQRRIPDPGAAPAMVDLASGDRVELARRFSVLAEAIHAAALDRPLDDFLALLCERLAGSLELSRVAIWGIDRSRTSVRRLSQRGAPLSELGDEVALERVGWYEAFLASDTAKVGEIEDFGEMPSPLLGVTTLFVAPLRVGDRLLGSVVGDRNGTPFALDAEQLAFAQAVANQAALALEVARLRAELALCDRTAGG